MVRAKYNFFSIDLRIYGDLLIISLHLVGQFSAPRKKTITPEIFLIRCCIFWVLLLLYFCGVIGQTDDDDGSLLTRISYRPLNILNYQESDFRAQICN